MKFSKAVLFLAGTFSAIAKGTATEAPADGDKYKIDMPDSLPFKVKIIRADVCDADYGWGKSDPYVNVVIIVNGKQKTCGRTDVKWNTHTPVYNKVIDCGTYTREVWEAGGKGIYMQLQMYDYDKTGGHDGLGKATVAKYWKYGERTSGEQGIASDKGSDCGTSKVWYSIDMPVITKKDCLQTKEGGPYRLVEETDTYYEIQKLYDSYKEHGYDIASPGDLVEVDGVKVKLDDKCGHKEYVEKVICTRCKGDDDGELGIVKVDADKLEELKETLGHLNVYLPGDRIKYLGGYGTVKDDCTVDPEKASSYGDPHFKKWNGELYDFHGGCDLVLLQNPHFSNGLGMNIHIRTSIRTWWSFIESTAVQLGENTLQITGSERGNPTFSINGGDVAELVTQKSSLGDFPVMFRRVNGHQTLTFVDVGHGDAISIETYKHFVRVNFKDKTHQAFQRSTGLLGTYPAGIMRARDGRTVITDPDEFGQHWTVRPSDPILFSDVEASSLPDKCTMPTEVSKEETRRRLEESSMTEEDAALACARVKEIDRDSCIFDVMATLDLDMAGSY